MCNMCPQGDIEIRVTILDVNDNPPTVENTLNITIEEVTFICVCMRVCSVCVYVCVCVGVCMRV